MSDIQGSIGTASRQRARRGEGDKLRDQIVDAAEKLMVETGDVESVSMRAIATAVGVTPPAIYLHFADKDELFDAICERSFSELNRRFAGAERATDDPLQRLILAGKAYMAFGIEHPEAYRFLMMTKTEDDYADMTTTEEPTQGDLAFLKLMALVDDCIKAGLIREMDTMEAALIVWSHVHGFTSLKITSPKFVWAEGLEDKLLEASIYGLAPR